MVKKAETKVIEMENKIEKMTQFLADNKIECFDIQKLEDEHHTTIFRSRGGKRTTVADGTFDG